MQEVDSEVARLLRTAGGTLMWAPRPCGDGPVCPVCHETCLALLVAGECGHAMCETCWVGWAGAQLEHCRRHAEIMPCFAAGCRSAVSPLVWNHTCSLLLEAASLERDLAHRRRLQSNALFPAPMQVNCPRSGCVGLGYLGSGTVMCFICEHQWAGGNDAAVGSGDEELGMVADVKRCPSCETPIVKNGGCDHMTCPCGHEFWWTTLKPYR